MEAISPVVPGHESSETVATAKYHPELYNPLPILQTARAVMSRWRLTPEEREYLASGGDLMIAQLNFGGKLQPIMPMAVPPEQALQMFIEGTT
jgi:hypothetical protein